MTETVEDRQLWIWYTPFGLGGVETFLLNLARTTVQRGSTVCVAAVQSFSGPLKAAFEQESIQLLDWTDFYPAYMNDSPGEEVCRRLTRDVAALRPTVLSINGCTDFATGAAPLLRRLKPYCTITDTFHINPPDDRFFHLRAPYAGLLDGISSSNDAALDRFKTALPSARTLPVRYIPYGAAVHARERRPPDSELRLLYVGRLVQEQKRILELPALLSRLKSSGRRFTLTIVGEGAQESELRDALARLDLLAHVRFAGYVQADEVIDFYFEHDVLLNISTYEGFSISVIEALAAGCVPVCTDLPGLDRSAFIDGVTCRLCPVDDLPRMAEILSVLTPEEIIRMSAAASEVGSALTIPRMVDRYETFFAELRSLRPLRLWTEDTESALEGVWDLSRHNPWLPHPHPVRKWARRALAWMRS
ncbi:MAG: glycosyltransferase family 4 protein [Acidobacteriota bacterium]|nr:glycosyltransferase family 4 protein [Acidobacteriota bacterium]